MTRFWRRALSALLVVFAAGGTLGAAEKSPDRPITPQQIADTIDQHFASSWEKAGIKPTRADDAEFLRRVSLDLAGRIPTVSEARAFLDDQSPDKRLKLITQLLQSPRYTTHWVNVWRSLLLPEASTNLQARFLAPGFESWLRLHLAKNTPYDQMVKELLTIPVGNGAAQRAFGGRDANPTAFYLAKEIKPENLAASTSRLFLGVRLECAQCHDHPFAQWKKEQFWTYAAFFSGLQGRPQGDFAVPGTEKENQREITIPGTDKVVKARYLDGSEPKWQDKVNTRTTLANWLTAPNNPYFARATVNRLWAHLFGVGLIDPVDEMFGAENINRHPELLEVLAQQFIASKFDLKVLLQGIVASKVYQTSSANHGKHAEDPFLFARMPLRGLTAEQLFDSVAQATGYRPGSRQQPQFFGQGGPRGEFLNRFGNATGEKATDVQTSILQALMLMNGEVVTQATSSQNSELLLAVMDNPFMDTSERLETLYLATLSRKPKAKELVRLTKYVEKGGSTEAKVNSSEERQKRYNQALADVFWALLNSGEFFLNH